MNMQGECLTCLYNQMLRVTNAIECDEPCKIDILKESAKNIANLDINQTPPEGASILYPAVSKIVNKEDLYQKQKEQSSKRAKEILEAIKPKVKEYKTLLSIALKVAVAGNVIDFATEVSFSLEKEIENIFQNSFAIDDSQLFLERLNNSKSLIVIGDNVGEHLFDKFMIELFKKEYPNLTIYYFTRGKPIINDITIKEAKEAKLDEVAILIDSGVDTPGFLYERASSKAKEIFDRADLILAKGMGNFECMESWADSRVFFLFKVKCQVVAKKIGKELGDLICMCGNRS